MVAMQRCPVAILNSTVQITDTPCLSRPKGRLSLPLPFGDPPARQVPLFIKWEDYGEYLGSFNDVTFVQIGANCGKNTYGCAAGGDPLWSYVTSCGWRGVALEPVSYVFRLLCKNYARWAHRITPLRGAVADAPGEARISLGGGETNKLILKAPPGPRPNETVPVVTLDHVWREFRRALHGTARGPDLLIIDAEGAEPRILGVPVEDEVDGHGGTATGSGRSQPATAQPRDLPSPLPSLILFEHSHLRHRDQRAIHSNLLRQGYAHLTDLRNRDPRGIHLPPANRLYGLKKQRGAGGSESQHVGKGKGRGAGTSGHAHHQM